MNPTRSTPTRINFHPISFVRHLYTASLLHGELFLHNVSFFIISVTLILDRFFDINTFLISLLTLTPYRWSFLFGNFFLMYFLFRSKVIFRAYSTLTVGRSIFFCIAFFFNIFLNIYFSRAKLTFRAKVILRAHLTRPHL